jgi:hypothetical protein
MGAMFNQKGGFLPCKRSFEDASVAFLSDHPD